LSHLTLLGVLFGLLYGFPVAASAQPDDTELADQVRIVFPQELILARDYPSSLSSITLAPVEQSRAESSQNRKRSRNADELPIRTHVIIGQPRGQIEYLGFRGLDQRRLRLRYKTPATFAPQYFSGDLFQFIDRLDAKSLLLIVENYSSIEEAIFKQKLNSKKDLKDHHVYMAWYLAMFVAEFYPAMKVGNNAAQYVCRFIKKNDQDWEKPWYCESWYKSWRTIWTELSGGSPYPDWFFVAFYQGWSAAFEEVKPKLDIVAGKLRHLPVKEFEEAVYSLSYLMSWYWTLSNTSVDLIESTFAGAHESLRKFNFHLSIPEIRTIIARHTWNHPDFYDDSYMPLFIARFSEP
jgi:hypothetical protein